jgi:hypothetical protein
MLVMLKKEGKKRTKPRDAVSRVLAAAGVGSGYRRRIEMVVEMVVVTDDDVAVVVVVVVLVTDSR